MSLGQVPPPEPGVWKQRGLLGNCIAAGVSCQLRQPCKQPLSLTAQGGLSVLQKFSGLVFFAVKSRAFADTIFTLRGINSQPEKQRKTPHEAHVRQSYGSTIYLFTYRSYFLPLLVRDLLCWPKVSFSSLARNLRISSTAGNRWITTPWPWQDRYMPTTGFGPTSCSEVLCIC